MQDQKFSSPCEMIVLSGFLGSGKTTLLNQLLSDPSLTDTAVLINEFGEIALDHLLVESVQDEVVVLENGCVCCAVRDDLVAAIIGLVERASRGQIAPFSRIIIETTGLAKLDSLLRLICEHRELTDLVRLRGTLVALDLVSGAETLTHHEEAVEQLILADLVVLTKGDLATPDQREASIGLAREWLGSTRVIEPEAISDLVAALDEVGRESSVSDMIELPTYLGPGSAHDLRCLCFRHDGAVERRQVEAWLGALCAAHDRNIIRMKGLIEVAGEDRPLFVQSVRQTIFPSQFIREWPDGRAQTQLVLFAKTLEIEAVENSFFAASQIKWLDPSAMDGQPPYDASYLGADAVLAMLGDQLHPNLSDLERLPPWLTNGLHNPWSRAASHYPSWQILDLARDSGVLGPVIDLLGDDIILFESELKILSRDATEKVHDHASFPVEPGVGASLVIPIIGSLKLGGQKCDQPTAVDASNPASISAAGPAAVSLVLRYFPSTSRFVRDPSHQTHVERRRKQLLIGSSTYPLWVAHGVDRAGNDMITGFNPTASRWSVFPAISAV